MSVGACRLWSLPCISLVVVCLASGCRTETGPEGPNLIVQALTPKCISVQGAQAIDGDTIDAPGLGRVRLVGIDCPERGEPGAEEAKAFVAGVLQHSTAEIAISPLWPEDVYGRKRAVVYVRTGGGHLCLNSELIRRGLARPSRQGPEAFDVLAWSKEESPGLPSWSEDLVPKSDPDWTLVFVTPSGGKYHRESCRYAKGGQVLSLRSAVRRGYEPCGVCRPPRIDR